MLTRNLVFVATIMLCSFIGFAQDTLLITTPYQSGGSILSYNTTTNELKKTVDFSIPKHVRSPVDLTYYDGKVWGIMKDGGTANVGLIFNLNTDGSEFTHVHNFGANFSSEGAQPVGGLTIVGDKLWGVTRAGGGSGHLGVIFRIDPLTLEIEVVHRMVEAVGYTTNKLTYHNGKLWGATSSNDLDYYGALFTFDVETFEFSVIQEFDRGGGFIFEMLPYNGRMYGSLSNARTTVGDGIIFSVNEDGTDYTIDFVFEEYIFPEEEYGGSPGNGEWVLKDGQFYGISNVGGDFFRGYVYSFDPITKEVTYHNQVDGTRLGRHVSIYPGESDTFLGLTAGNREGQLFTLESPSSQLNMTHSFVEESGYFPVGRLTVIEGAYWGIVLEGANNNAGGIFKVNFDGSGYQKIYDFDQGNGTTPLGQMIRNGRYLFGINSAGGAYGNGTIYRTDLEGENITKIMDLNQETGYGSEFRIKKIAGVLWGATQLGGVYGDGTLFKINLDGSGFQVVHDFDGAPRGELTLFNGRLWGTGSGGINRHGYIYSLNVQGQDFKVEYRYPNSYGGKSPEHLVAHDDALWGTNQYGGDNRLGTLFSFNPETDEYLVHHHFEDDAKLPRSLIWAQGKFWGMARHDFSFVGAAIFSYDPIEKEFEVPRYLTNDTNTGPMEGRNHFGFLSPLGDELFGHASGGGTFNGGTLFRYNITDDEFEVLHHYDRNLGTNPLKGSVTIVVDNEIPEALVMPTIEVFEDQENLPSLPLDEFFDDKENGPESLVYTIDSTDNSGILDTLFVNNSNALNFVLSPDQFGTANVYLRATDKYRDCIQNDYLLIVNPTADTPSVTNAECTYGEQTQDGLIVNRNPVDGPEVPFYKVTEITNGTLYHPDGITEITEGEFVSFEPDPSSLKYTPLTAKQGSFSIQASTSEDDSGLGGEVVTAIIDVLKAELLATVDNKTKPFGNSNPELTITYTGFVSEDNEETLLEKPILSTEATENSPIGDYEITVSGGSDDNYEISAENGIISVTPRTVNVTADAKNKIYGELDPALTYVATELYGNDDLTGELERVPGEDVETYAITQGSISAGNNYIINFTGNDFTIDEKGITVIPDDAAKTFGDVDPNLTYHITDGNLVGSDDFTGSLEREVGEDADTYDIIQGSLELSSNYLLTFQKGAFTINPKRVTVTADPLNKTYGASDPTFTYFRESLNGDDTYSGDLERALGEDVGIYNITKGSLTAGDNYLISFNEASFEITPREVVVTADKLTKTYGETDPELTYVGESLNGDDTYIGGLERAMGETVGVYSIMQGTLTAGENYQITFNEGMLEINKASLLVISDDKEMEEGGNLPELTMRFEGFVNGENETVLDELPVLSTDADVTSPAGTYEIFVSSVTDNNYLLTTQFGVLTISPVLGLSRDLQISLYPNPATDYLNFDLKEPADYIILINLQGREMDRIQPNRTTSFEISQYPAGIYLVLIERNGIRSVAGRVVKLKVN